MKSFLKTERLIMRSISSEDLAEMAELLSDREIGILSGQVFPLTEKKIHDFYKKCQNTDDRIWFIIIDRSSGKIIGETGFLRIFYPWRCADFSLMILDRKYWEKGYGKETAHIMLDYGFNYLNLHRIAIGVVGINERALKFWKTIGFKEEGKQIEGFYCNGKFSDFIMMHILDTDFNNF